MGGRENPTKRRAEKMVGVRDIGEEVVWQSATIVRCRFRFVEAYKIIVNIFPTPEVRDINAI